MSRVLKIFVLLLSLALQPVLAEVLADPIKITTLEKDGRHTLIMENTSRVPVTYRFDFTFENARLEDPLQKLLVIPALKKVQGPVILRADDRKSWKWNYLSYYHFGDYTATSSEEPFYLPYQSGQEFEVIQSFNGDYSHQANEAYAVDFEMDIGTKVMCAKEGLVVGVVEDSNEGGSDRAYKEKANTVVIAHRDGTLARYVHLRPDGAEVELGTWVKDNQLVGYSGNTGYSSTPHLHFDVYKPSRSFTVETLPFEFRINGKRVEPVEGASYLK